MPEIERATPDQARILTDLAFAAKRHWGYPERWIQIWKPLLTITPELIERHETYVAWMDNQPAGFCAISKEGEGASLEHLWVLPKYIGKGIGTALLRYIISRCKELGVGALEIESDPHAQGFYERMGAKKISQVVGEIDGEPRVLPLLEIKIMKNFGPKSTEWLASVGIQSLDDVAELGVVETYRRVKAAYPEKVSLNLLYSLQAALLDLSWNELPLDIKDELKRQVGEES